MVWSAGAPSVGTLLAQQAIRCPGNNTGSWALAGTLGEVAVRVKAGTPADTDFDVARDGFIVVDTTRATMWLRAGGTWHDVAGSTPKLAFAARTSAQSIPNGAWTAVDFTAADVSDPFAFHDPSSNSTRFTVPTGWAGTYLCVANANYASFVATIIAMGLGLNGSDPVVNYQHYWAQNAASAPLQSATWVKELAAGDYVELRVIQNQGIAQNLNNASFGVVLPRRAGLKGTMERYA